MRLDPRTEEKLLILPYTPDPIRALIEEAVRAERGACIESIHRLQYSPTLTIQSHEWAEAVRHDALHRDVGRTSAEIEAYRAGMGEEGGQNG